MPEGFPIMPPVVVAEGWDLSFYGSTDDIVREIEPWFPSEAEYRVFDSQGVDSSSSPLPPGDAQST